MKVTIVGPSGIYPARDSVSTGDEIALHKELSSEFGKTVKVYNDSGEQIGFVAAKTSTASVGTELADKVYDSKKINDISKGKIEDVIAVGKNTVITASIIEEENEMENMEKEVKLAGASVDKGPFREVKANIGGLKRTYVEKYTPVRILKDSGEDVACKLEFNDKEDLCVVLFEKTPGEFLPCGHIEVTKSDGDDSVTYDELKKLIAQYTVDGEAPEIEAFIKKEQKGAFKTSTKVCAVVTIRIYGETAMEQAISTVSSDFDESKFNELKKWIEELNLSEKAVLNVFDLIKVNSKQDASRIPKKTIFNNYDEVVEDMIYSIISNSNTMLVGPMAAGKNTSLESLAYYFQKALYEIQVNSYIDNDVLLGTRTIKAKESATNRDKINEEGMKLIKAISGMSNRAQLKNAIENGDSKEQIQAVEEAEMCNGIDFSILIDAIRNGETEVTFQPSVLVKAMEEGSWLVIDEFNTGQPSVMAVLNSVLDARRRIQVPGYGLVQAAPGFRLFATMNPDYEGTFELNPATASRFNHIMFRAADKISPIILSRVPDASKTFLNNAENLYKKIRQGIDSGKFQEESINVRGFIEAARMVSLGRSVKRAMITCVANSVRDKDDRDAIKGFIDINIAE